LVDVFGMTPADLTTAGDRAVHGEVFAGDGVIWLPPENQEHKLASPMRPRSYSAVNTRLRVARIVESPVHHQPEPAEGLQWSSSS
jgi:hypothetical protein